MKRYAAIGLGGMLGASLRWAVGAAFDTSGLPWSTLVVNLVGCFALGVIIATQIVDAKASLWLHDFGGIGFCGGLTTMSTFAVGTVVLSNDAQLKVAIGYVAVSVIGGFIFMVLGSSVLRWFKPLDAPSETRA